MIAFGETKTGSPQEMQTVYDQSFGLPCRNHAALQRLVEAKDDDTGRTCDLGDDQYAGNCKRRNRDKIVRLRTSQR